jgi:hypothetical protein
MAARSNPKSLTPGQFTTASAAHRPEDRQDKEIVPLGKTRSSLGNVAFASGYWIRSDRIGDAGWTEIFNSDAAVYGGSNVGNAGATLIGSNGALNVILPAPGLVVLWRN